MKTKYKPLLISTVAKQVGLTLGELYDLFTEEHFVAVLKLGWRPFVRQLNEQTLNYIDKNVLKPNGYKRHESV